MVRSGQKVAKSMDLRKLGKIDILEAIGVKFRSANRSTDAIIFRNLALDFGQIAEFANKKEEELALQRGIQVVFANNPISGLLIVGSLAAAAPSMLLLSMGTGLLGLLVSMLTNEQQATIGNGLTVYNPVLVGALTYSLIPKSYDPFEPFPLFLIFLGTVFSVYLARSIGSGRFPCLTWPAVVVEFLLLFVLTLNNHSPKVNSTISTLNSTDNATSDAKMEYASHIVENGTAVNLDWGMVLQGAVTSASQVFALNDVAAGSIIYLALLIYSPAMAALSFIGALAGCLLGLLLGVPQHTVYDGIWGFNSLLTGSAMGGTFLVLNRQTVVATLIAVLFCPVLQFVLAPIAAKWGLPVLAAPFVLTVWLFLGLRDSPGHTFPRPECMSFPEKQRYDFLETQHALQSNRAEGSGEPETSTRKEKRISSTSCDLCT